MIKKAEDDKVSFGGEKVEGAEEREVGKDEEK